MLRAERREIARGPMAARCWQALRREWQRRQDRSVALAVLARGHEGTAADYRMASRGR
jgi:hypothetical protein